MKQVMDYIMATKLKGYTIECLRDYYEDDPADVKKCTLNSREVRTARKAVLILKKCN